MILAIDCGSSSLKAALFDEDLLRVQAVSVPVVYTVRDRDRAELDPEDVWSRFCTLLDAFPSVASVRSIALTSQAQTFTVLDRNDHPLRPFLSWMDRRAEAEAEIFRVRLGPDFHSHCSFACATPGLQASKVLWTQRRTEALRAGGRVAALPEFLCTRLAGFRGLDRNLAAMSGMYSLERGRWWGEALELCEVSQDQLGVLVDVGARVEAGATKAGRSFGARAELVLAGNDQTAGAYAALGGTGGLVITLGTALVAYRFAGAEPGPSHAAGCWGPYPGGGYYELATVDEGCAALDWAASVLMPGRPLAEFDRAARSTVPGSALFFPSQMRTPAAWIGERGADARARAVLEGIAFSARRLVNDGLGTATNGATRVLVAGGGSVSDVWVQMLADILGCPCERAQSDSVLGAARIAASGREVAPHAGSRCVFEPSPEGTSQYAEIYARWSSADLSRERSDG